LAIKEFCFHSKGILKVGSEFLCLGFFYVLFHLTSDPWWSRCRIRTADQKSRRSKLRESVPQGSSNDFADGYVGGIVCSLMLPQPASTHPLERRDQLTETPLLVLQSPDRGLRMFNEWLFNRKYEGFYLHPSLAFMYLPKIEGYGVGIWAPLDLSEGEVVAKIPKSWILSVRTVSNEELKIALVKHYFVNMIGLTIAYIYESGRKNQSPFYGYLTCFSVPDVPRLWSDHERALLEGTDIDILGGASLVDCRIELYTNLSG